LYMDESKVRERSVEVLGRVKEVLPVDWVKDRDRALDGPLELLAPELLDARRTWPLRGDGCGDGCGEAEAVDAELDAPASSRKDQLPAR
jgi:hypothetical protein